jgi:peptidoglycan/xylan/chitin deacetylase (PgdA/CDA1 family)
MGGPGGAFINSGIRMAIRRRIRLAAVSLALCLLGLDVGRARAEGVALTFDDVPGLSLTNDAGYLRTTNRELLRGLRERRLRATAFVIGDKLEDPDRAAKYQLVRDWLDAGFTLGNHTYSHASLNKTPVEAYIADVAREDALLRPLMAERRQTPHWFRHPYLDTGKTLADKHAFESWLVAHGYRVAPVTAENADWMFALPYDEAVMHHDRRAARRIREAYLDYTGKAVAWYREAAFELLGRRPALVLLLHDTRLNADTLGGLAEILKKNGLQVVSLDRAMNDPAYRVSDDFADPDGDEWLSRWSTTLNRPLPWDSFPEPPADIAAANDRLDQEP